ncbi:MAG: CoA transferase [Bacteroidetes bacterium]|nr:CoA transferase [Bacteroidota bacterium]
MLQNPLTGITILDLTRLLPGPLCTLHLADLGADVIKVEDTGLGDYARFAPPLQKTTSSFFLALNRNKRSIAIDLTKENGKKIFMKLSETADVIVESFRPGVVKKLGIDYEAAKKVNPEIIYCSITGYGQTGPYRDKAGHDLNFISMAGILKSEIPSIPNFQIADITGGALNAAMGILAALYQKKNTDKGQYIDVSILDGLLANNVTAVSDLSGKDFPGGMLTGSLPCYNIYETADGRYMAIAAIEFKFWKIFCETVGREDLLSHHLVSGGEAEKVKTELENIFRTKTLSGWTERFKNVDCCVSPVLTLPETAKNEQVMARNMVISEEHPSEGTVTQFNIPVKFSGFERDTSRPAPMHGEHTFEILTTLGYSQQEIDNLVSQNAVRLFI